MQFAYGGCGIRHVDVLNYNASSTPTAVSRLPESGPTPSVAVRFDGWVLPTAGVVFVWVLENEVASDTEDGDRDVDLRGTSVRARARKGR